MNWNMFYTKNIEKKYTTDLLIKEISSLFQKMLKEENPLTAFYNEDDKYWTLSYKTNNTANYGYFDIELYENGKIEVCSFFNWNKHLLNFDIKEKFSMKQVESCLTILLLLDKLYLVGIPCPEVIFEENDISSIEWDVGNESTVVAHYLENNVICYSSIGDIDFCGVLNLDTIDKLNIFKQGDKNE